MRTFTLLIASLALGLNAVAQDVGRADITDLDALPKVLGFENDRAGEPPSGWSGGPVGTVFVDTRVVHEGGGAARLERDALSPGQFTSLHRAVAMDVVGRKVELKGFLRTEDVDGFAGLWLRADSRDGKTLGFENMARRNVHGTTNWGQYAIAVQVDPQAHRLFFGALLSGTGKAWVDDLELLVDGKPIWQAAKKPPPRPTVLDTDHRFDGGSGISLATLSETQIENLTTLGQVWGFLKYRHPAVTAGKVHWDYALMEVLPKVLKATGRTAGNRALVKWIEALGPLARCVRCARFDERDLHLRPDLKWIRDEARLGAALSAKLRAIERNRPASGPQFYVSLAPNVGNPLFDDEAAYDSIKFPDAGFQLLALYRFWNIVEYWSPNRDVIGEDWHAVLRVFVPRLALATNVDDYRRELWALLARLNDGHTGLQNAYAARPPTGECYFPFSIRFVEDKPVIADLADKRAELEVGDVIEAIDGVPIETLLEKWRPYYPASNDWARRSRMAHSMGRGPCGEGDLRLRRGGEALSVRLPRANDAQISLSVPRDLPGPTFRMLSKDVAYMKLSTIRAAGIAGDIETAATAQGLIVDIRNYPSEFVVFALGSLLVKEPTPFARFTLPDLDHPGVFRWGPPVVLEPAAPRFTGKVVVLIDETSQSQSEYTAMALRAAPRTALVGSPTAGADGNVSRFALPGGLTTAISGLGVFYPDKRATQRVGIIPDVTAAPTIQGTREGRDEVLEEAIRQILGKDASDDEIRRIAQPDTLGAFR